MSNFLSPSVGARELPAQIPQIRAANTSVMAFVGIFEKGPIGEPVRVSSWDQWTKIFGGFLANSDAPMAVYQFYQQVRGGRAETVTVRTAHYTDPATPSSVTAAKASVTLQNATPANTLKVDGKYHGTYANLSLVIQAATSGVTEEFDAVLKKGTTILEHWKNLTMGAYSSATPTDRNYAPRVVNADLGGSENIALVDQLVSGTAAQRRPANGSFSLTSGSDGLTSLADADFIGSSTGATGLYALDAVEDVTLLAVPGRTASAMQAAMISYCGTHREGQIFAVLDPLAAQSVSQIITFVKTTNSLLNATEHAAIFYPELIVANPNKTIYGPDDTLTIPPSGAVAGVFVRNDQELIGGIHQQPAGINRGRLIGVLGTANNDNVKKLAQRDLLYPANINPIWKDNSNPLHIGGVAVLDRTGNWPSIAERRGVSYIVSSFRNSLPEFLFDNIDDSLLERIKRSATAFLLIETRNGAFASKNPKEAFFVDTGEAVNPRSQWRLRKVSILLGLAKATPNEFIDLMVTRDLRAEQASLDAALNL